MLILAVDANFKMKNVIRVNEHNDPPLGSGWGAFVEPSEYKEHLRTYVPKKDVSLVCHHQLGTDADQCTRLAHVSCSQRCFRRTQETQWA
jgi:hypothetical protein